MPGRICTGCNRDLDEFSYSANQWKKPIGLSKCNACVHAGTKVSKQFDRIASRENISAEASFSFKSLSNPIATGSFRHVALGHYMTGPRMLEPCVTKWFKGPANVLEEYFYNLDIQAVDKANHMVQKWNDENFIETPIRINRPEVWQFTADSSKMWAGKKNLQEPFIQNYERFNSNTGWFCDETPWQRIMQAVSHFSYHSSGGQYVICDLQGGVYQDSVVLTDPVVLSRKRMYGVTDLGARGIATFFTRHECNEFCKDNWQLPIDANEYFEEMMGTSMGWFQ